MKYYNKCDYNQLYSDYGKKFISSRKKRDNGAKFLNVACAFDTETTSFYELFDTGKTDRNNNPVIDKRKRACLYLWQFGIGDYIFYGRKTSEFVEFLNNIKKKFRLSAKRKIIIYVHNLAYDFQFIRHYFNVSDIFAREELKPIYAELNECFVFKCSYILTNKSLNLLSEETTTKKLVGDIDYTLFRHSETLLTDKEKQYAENDIKIILEYITMQIEKEGGNITKIPLTSTGYVRRYYLQYLQKNYNFNEYKRKYNCVIQLDIDVFQMLEKAFAGGYTHANYINVDTICYNVKSVDFTSSYPFVICSEKFPMKKFQKIKIESKQQFLNYIQDRPAVFKIIFKDITAKTNITTISKSKCRFGSDLDEKSHIPLKDRKYIFDNGRVKKARMLETTITDIDFKIIDKFYDFKDYVIYDFYVSRYDYLPKALIECVLQLYNDKTKLKGIEGKEELYQVAKALLNAFYGMCVTNPLSDDIIFDDENGWSTNEIDDKYQLSAKLSESENKYSSVLSFAWGVWVTAYARKNLLDMVYIIGDDVIYCDTDSIKYMNYTKYENDIECYNEELFNRAIRVANRYKIDIEKLSPKDIKGKIHKIGIFTDEGNYSHFKTLGAKRYLTCKDNKYIQITVSGVSKKDFYRYLKSIYGGEVAENKQYYISPSDEITQQIFDMFADGLSIPAEYTGKQTHTYITDFYECVLTDYNGIKSKVSEYNYIHLEPQPYKLGLKDEFEELITIYRFMNPHKKKIKGVLI